MDSAVAGVSVGLMTSLDAATDAERWEAGSYKLLSDIRGLEDHYGDMDFKTAGTGEGLTAVQLDIKLQGGVPVPVLCDALAIADDARLRILQQMNDVITRPNAELKSSAPQSVVLALSPSIKGLVIGKSGAMVRNLEKMFSATISLGESVDKDGHFKLDIMASSSDDIAKAEAAIRGVVLYNPASGEECDCIVTKTNRAGALVRVRAASPLAKSLLEREELEALWDISSSEGFVPMSLLQHEFTEEVSDVVLPGQMFRAVRMKDQPGSKKGSCVLNRKQLLPVPENLAQQPTQRHRVPQRRRD